MPKSNQKNTALPITIVICVTVVVLAGIFAFLYMRTGSPAKSVDNNKATVDWSNHNSDGQLVSQKWGAFVNSCTQNLKAARPNLADGSFESELKVGNYCGVCSKDALTDMYYANIGKAKPSNEPYHEDFEAQLRDANSILAWGDSHAVALSDQVKAKCVPALN